MGERITGLAVSAFRGVRDTWEVDFPGGRSMVVLGDNGTGKSTVADALEWYFRGRIEFLAREGREKAIRHVGANGATQTQVKVATNGHLGGSQRAPAGGGPWLPAKVRDNFVLRGRTLSEFVEQPKAQKWRTLADILGLQEVDAVRLDLQTVRNQVQDEADRTARETARKAAALKARVQPIDEDRLLAVIREECSSSSLSPPGSLDEALDPTWAVVASPTASTARAVAASTLLGAVTAARANQVIVDGIDTWNTHIEGVNQADAHRLNFLTAAEAMLQSDPDDGTCPLCGQTADRIAILDMVGRSLAELRAAAEAHEQAARSLQTAIRAVAENGDLLTGLHQSAQGAGISDLPEPPIPPHATLTAALQGGHAAPRDAVDEYLAKADGWLGNVERVAEALPPAPNREAGLVGLGILCEQGRGWRSARAGHEAAKRALALATQLHAGYQQAEMEHYEGILSAISSRVAELYESLHPSEGLAGVVVEPWTEKGLELALDFHGKHQRPPHGVLSESHLNSLAVALFLAMAEMFNDELDLVVLDDVINSFDIEHRGRLAELLVAEFNPRQLIVLTHDHQFFQHLVRRAPGWETMHLTSWAFDEGPRTSKYLVGRFTDAANEALGSGDTHGAAVKARRALEELLDEACEALEAPLPFRRGPRNDRREIGELMSGLRSHLKTTASTWYRQLESLLAALEADVQAALNVEAHAARGWASSREVQDALGRVRSLDARFSCPKCGSRIWAKGNRDAGRCNCGTSTYPPQPEGRGPAVPGPT
jgi:RecF/RecN/SMC N terminal domain